MRIPRMFSEKKPLIFPVTSLMNRKFSLITRFIEKDSSAITGIARKESSASRQSSVSIITTIPASRNTSRKRFKNTSE